MLNTYHAAVPAAPPLPRAHSRDRVAVLTLPWHRLALGAVLLLAAVLNFWQLGRLGYPNSYYAAAVKSMLQSWHNFFFVSFDPGGFVSIDKPPLGFWIETASARLFGFSAFSLLLPEALAGVLSVAVLYRLVARVWGSGAGLLAALFLALTPVSVVTARNNTIDSLLVLSVLLAAWAVSRAAESGRLRWLLLCAVLVGLGFNIKMLDAYLVVPAFGLMYLLCARTGWLTRISHLALSTLVMLGVSLSWAVVVDLTPAGARPFVGSSGDNSALNLALGYNGLQRLTGGAGTPGGGGAGGNGLFNGGPAGLFRLIGTTLGGQVSWLLILAVLGLAVAVISVPWRRLDGRGRSLILWGTWLLVVGAFFSVAEFFHPYYTVMLAPAISALAAIGVSVLWRSYRNGERRGWLLPVVLLATAGVQAYILRDYPTWSRWLTPLVVGACALAALALIVARLRLRRVTWVALAAAGLALTALLAAPTTWAAYSLAHGTNGTIPTAGPSAQTAGGFGGGPGGFGGGPGAFGGADGPGVSSGSTTGSGSPSGAPPSGAVPSAGGTNGSTTNGGTTNGSTTSGSSTGGTTSGGTTSGGTTSGALGASGSAATTPGSAATTTAAARGGRPGGAGGGFGGAQVDAALVRYLEAHQGTATYLVATASSQDASSIIISTGRAVMALGGFSGNDQILTTAQLARLVAAGKIHYFLIQGGGMGGGRGGGGNSALQQWVQSHGTAVPASAYDGSSTTTTGGFGQATLYYVSSSAASK
jgi:4-amino-4-deoxy-L-arabinose transferase-like glycosyltransferase